MRILIAIVILSGILSDLNGQTHFNDRWIGGGGRIFEIDFTVNPVHVSYFIDTNKVIYAGLGNSSICDSAGRAILFCDGYNI